MADLSTYLKEKLCKHVGGIAAYTMPSTLYLRLYSTATTDGGGGTEISGGGYAPQAVTMQYDAGNVEAENAGVITFGPATGADWPAATHCALWDASSGGNMLVHDALSSPVTVAVSEEVEFQIGQVRLSFDQGT